MSKQCAEAEAARQAQLTATKALLQKASETSAVLAGQTQQLEALEARCGSAEASRDALLEELEGLKRTMAEEIGMIKKRHDDQISALKTQMVIMGW